MENYTNGFIKDLLETFLGESGALHELVRSDFRCQFTAFFPRNGLSKEAFIVRQIALCCNDEEGRSWAVQADLGMPLGLDVLPVCSV